MLFAKIASIAAVLSQGAMAEREWRDCNDCLAKCIDREDNRNRANCKDWGDDWCVFRSQEFHNAVSECSSRECGKVCASIREIYRQIHDENKVKPAREAYTLNWLESTSKEKGRSSHMRRAAPEQKRSKPASPEQERSNLHDCGCGHPKCDCPLPPPTGASDCVQGKPRRHSRIERESKVKNLSPECARVCLADQVFHNAHLWPLDKNLGDSICNDPGYIPGCCAKLTGNNIELVEKAHRWVKNFCREKRGETIIEVTGGFGGPYTGKVFEEAMDKVQLPSFERGDDRA